jgi:aspartyl-tRNA(Asn)/glutamyl-tRNA(Gln) amidotransferase subunit A
MTLAEQSVTELRRGLEEGSFTAEELCEACLETIERHEESIRAFVHVDRTAAMQTAQAVDYRRETGQPLGALAGIPIAVKDNICARGGATTCASRMLEQFIPPYDATVIERLKAADAVIIGRTNLDEFAMGGSTENSVVGPTKNPWNNASVPGGSSGGSAACVSARMTPLALGSDTGGSIRQPASFCGVVGMKPTYGRVSRYGLVAFASSLDQIGPIARTVQDAALLLETIGGHDAKDSTSATVSLPKFSETATRPLANLRLGIVREHFGEGVNADVEAAVREAIAVFRSLGAEIVDISLPHNPYAIATYYVIAPCEASSNLARYDGVHFGFRASDAQDRQDEGALVAMVRTTRSEGFGAEVKRRIMLGTYALSAGYYDAYYLKALKVRRLIRQDYDAAFGRVDMVAGPVTPTPAFQIGERISDPLEMYLGDLFTVSANLAGIPSISIPCGFSDHGLPIGLQLQGRAFDEERLFRAGHMFQNATHWHTKSPHDQ